MAITSRYSLIKSKIESGEITLFSGLFPQLDKRSFAEDIGIDYDRFILLANSPGDFTWNETFVMAYLLDVKKEAMMKLILNQLITDALMVGKEREERKKGR